MKKIIRNLTFAIAGMLSIGNALSAEVGKDDIEKAFPREEIQKILTTDSENDVKKSELVELLLKRFEKWRDSPKINGQDYKTILTDITQKLLDEKAKSNIIQVALFRAANAIAEKVSASEAAIKDEREGFTLAQIRRYAEAEVNDVVLSAIEGVRTKKIIGVGDSRYSFYVGSVNSLQGDGSWKGATEWSFQSETVWPGFKNSQRLKGVSEFIFSEIGKISDGSTTSTGNPFSSGGGTFRFNGSLQYLFMKNLGATVGLGYSTVPSDNQDMTDARQRYFLGAVFPARYGTNSTASLVIAWADDKLWEWTEMVGGSPVKHDESERIVVDALLDIPAVFKSDDVRLAVRVYTDLPVSQEGPSDIRVSLLFSASLDKLFN